ncbi:MAG: urease accessory protein UreF [Litoreibacter sp.]|nr:urease accessory protein UreF [Litoreibacter sp.]
MTIAMNTGTIMDTAIHMPTELSPAQLMLLTQWLSPSFPVGAFTYSHGLELILAEHPKTDVEAWLTQILRHGAGWNDAILLRAGYLGDAQEADALGRALAPSKERALEADAQGTAFCKALTGAFAIDLGQLIYPVAIGAAAKTKNLPLEPVVELYLHSFISNLIGAAQRLSPLGQTRAQAMLTRLGAVCEEVAQETRGLTLDDLGGATWAADAASMRHETQETRIFRT